MELKAQYSTHDVGLFVGFSSIQSDYGERGDFASTFDNQGISLTLAHYMHFFKQSTRWNSGNEVFNNLMVRSEINYISHSKIKHYGVYAKGTGDEALRLAAMTGSVSMINLGVNLEYYFFNLEEFIHPYSDSSFNPYFSFGARYTFYENTLSSSFGSGDWMTDSNVLPRKYRPSNSKNIGTGGAFSAVLGVGFRYKLTERFDISTLISYQLFLSDEVDGLDASVKENKYNENLINFQVGLVYHLNFSSPLF